MNVVAASWLCVVLSWAMGYSGTVFRLSGMVTPLTWLPADFTSVTYTMPASASPRLTFVSTDFTSCSWLTGVTVIPALANVVAEYVPHGTPGAHTTTLIAGLARSFTDVMCLGLPDCTAISSLLWANTDVAPETNPPLTTFCMFGW